MKLSEEEKLQLKQSLKDYCIQVLTDRIANIESAMQSAQESANSEEKSSAGDKYETGRSMAQLTKEMNAKQLEEARADLAAIHQIDVSGIHTKVLKGSVVVCKDFVFFVSTGLGQGTLSGKKYMLLSPSAPLAVALKQKEAGSTFTFNAKQVQILEVF